MHAASEPLPAMQVLIGIVGYCGFVRGYPLGPGLMERLTARRWPQQVEIRELNWGPVAIVQDLQARDCQPDRVVLVGALDRGLPSGSVSCRRWDGGDLDPAAVQRRMFEAVTGIISLDNLLVIGAHFAVWPAQTLTVELQWPESGLSDLVLEEIDAVRGSAAVVGEQQLSPANATIVERIVDAVVAAALDDPPPAVQSLTIEQLTPVAPVLQHRFVEGESRPPLH